MVDHVMEDTTTTLTKAVDFDEMLSVAGDCGVYQVRLFLLIGVMQFVAIDAFAINFIAGSMDHWCFVRQLQHNFSADEQRRMAVPPDDDGSGLGFSRCYRYVVDWDRVDIARLNASVWEVNASETAVTRCDEWSYDHSLFSSTIVSRVRSFTPRTCAVLCRVYT